MIKISRICFLMLFLFAKINSIAQTSTPGAGMTDIDGNVYPTIILGTQEWCKENLKTTKFRNGDLIPYISSNVTWANSTTPAKCIYNNDSLQHYNVFGYLYNFYAVEDPRNLCPSGWHVPSDYEWTVLTNHLGGLPVAGGKMKSLNLWNAPNTGATNITGFTALPGGLRDYPGNFSSIFALGNWWSSTPRQMVGYVDGWYRDIWFNSAQLERLSYSKKDGFSVRCIRDSICSIDTSVYLNIPPTINACGDSTLINAGAGYTSYIWNTGSITSSIYAKATGWYKVTVSNGTCTATDSVYVSLVKAKITASKTRICKGETITLQADTTVGSLLACAKTDLPSNLQTGLVAYYPFCGNANDASGNGNHGTVNGATLTIDRFGNANSCYQFTNNIYSKIVVGHSSLFNFTNKFSISYWMKFDNSWSYGVINTIFKKLAFTNNGWGSGINQDNSQYGVGYFTCGFACYPAAINTYPNMSINYSFLNQWHLVITSYDSDSIKLYIDGVKISSVPFNQNVLNNTEPLIIGGTENLASSQSAHRKIDEVGIWNRALTASEIQQYYNSSAPQTQTYTWNTGATSNAISVTPTTTTKYYLTVNNGTSSCIDSVTIVVDTISPPTLPNNLNACGDSVLLNPASNGKYLWNTGDTTSSIYAKATGWYKVIVSNGTCTATDSVYVSLVKAKITASKTRICKGETITLQADTTVSSLLACAKTDLPSNLQTGLVAYYPFCGNANDASGNGSNGTVFGATLTNDRFGKPNNAYHFNGISNYISAAHNPSMITNGTLTISCWFKTNSWIANGTETYLFTKQTNLGNGQIGYHGYVYGGSPGNPMKATTFRYRNGNFSTWGDVSYLFNNSYSVNDWVNLVFTYNNVQTSVFVNGVLVNSSSSVVLGESTNLLYLGSILGVSQFFNGDLDDVIIWNRVLSNTEINNYYKSNAPQFYSWSNAATTNAISVTPTTTTKYYLTVNNGTSSCIDSVTIVVDSLPVPNLQDTLKVCGDSTLLNPGSFAKYAWSNGDTTATLTAKASGMYKVTVSNAAGCTATDSVYVSLVKAKITASKTRICKGETIILQADTTVGSLLACAKTDLPSNLQTGLVAYYPFCGNANDASGNGSNGTVFGATLTTDRYGRASSAYSFNGNNDYIKILPNVNLNQLTGSITVSAWINNTGKGNASYSNQDLQGIFGPSTWLVDDGGFLLRIYNPVYANSLNRKINFGVSKPYLGLNSLSNIDTLKWEFIVASYDGNNIKIYKNGVLENSQVVGSTLTATNNFIGRYFTIGQCIDWMTPTTLQSFKGKIDEVGIWNRALTASEIQQYYSSSAPQNQTYIWNTGATSNAISVTPTTTTKYYLTVNNGTSTCIDSVTIVVDSLPVPNLQDTLKVCGDSTLLNPGSFAKYAWSNGDTTATLTAKASGMYKVTVSNAAGCTATDSSYVSLVKAKINASKTRICKGETITLQADTTVGSLLACAKTDLPSNLQTGLVAYYPFCGNANDASGNGNHGTVNGATLTTDRFGRANSSYSFDGLSNYISTNTSIPAGSNAKSINLWVKFNSNSDRGWLVSNNTCINGSQYNGFGIFQEGPLNKILFYGMTGGDVDFSFPIQTNKYYNIVCTFSDDTLKIYVDGQIKASSYNPLQTIGNNGLLIGKRFSGNLPPPCGWDNGSNGLFNGSLDDIGIWNRALSISEIQQLYASGSPQSQTYNWSTINTNLGTDTLLKVTPTTTTKYYLTVNNGTSSCIDSVTIVVDELPNTAIPKNIKYCGDSIRILPDTNFVSYVWNTGRSSKTIYADTSGWYKLTVTDVNGCINKDSALVSVIKSKIIAPITNTCYGSPLFLYADTLAKKSKLYPSNISWLPNNETTSKIKLTGVIGGYNKLQVSDGIQTCRDSVLITVNELPIPSVPKNIKYCGDSIRILPDTNFVSYLWNTGKSAKTIYADTSGWYKLTVTDANACVNKDSSLVSVIKSKIIAPITNTCYGSPLFLYADTLAKKSKLYPSNISWLPNNETTSKITMNGLSGAYYKLIVSNTVHSCRDSVLITVNALPIPSVPKNIKHCGDSIRIIPDTNFVSYVWNTGKSSKTIYADTSGWYKLTVTDANACVNKDSSLVSVIKAEIKSDTITFCKGNHVNLKAIYKNPQSIVYPDQLLWSTTEQTPVIQVSPLTNSTYNLTVSNAIGGICSAQVALTVNNITADLFGKDTLYVCNDSAIVTALNGLHNFVWKPLTSNTQQVVVKQNGWVYLTAQNANNCLSSDSIYVYFTNTDFQLSDTVVCSGAGIITANPIEKGGTFIGTHVVNNQFTIPSKGGLYNITYSINNGTCTKTTTKWIRVIQRKDPTFVASTNKLCRADGPVQFTFSDTSGLFYKDNLLYTSKQFLADKVGKYIFKYEVRSEMCIDSNNQTIEVIERPNANFNPSKLIACVGDLPIQLNPEVNGGLFTGQYVKQNTFDPQKSGNYPILYKISNQLCNDSNIKTIKVYDKPDGSITYTPPMPFMNDTVSFTFNGSKVSQYIWEFGNAASPETSKLANPKVVYLGFGIQNVSVTVTDSVGCSATFTRNVNVQNRSTLFVPNAFTPTSDGNNEYFLAVGDGIISYKMLIFNRWGELLFESNDINKGWDGKFQGVLCPSGVYTYFIDAAGSDDRAYQFNGTVTLIR